MSVFSEEFKKAISSLPSKEKDKLLFRLLKKDLKLANKLMFELVDTRSVEERREIMENHILKSVAKMSESFYSIGYLNMSIRYLSGDITEHVRITKDKYGEVSLNLLLLIEVLKQNREHILNSKAYTKVHKLTSALIARGYKILILINKMDEDFLLDFKEDLAILAHLLADNPVVMRTAINNVFDLNWLCRAEIPSNIEAIQKDLRAQGFLK